jgi:hypothetical protein
MEVQLAVRSAPHNLRKGVSNQIVPFVTRK